MVITLPETNIAPENGWLEYHVPFGMAYFQGYVSFRECILLMSDECSLRSPDLVHQQC